MYDRYPHCRLFTCSPPPTYLILSGFLRSFFLSRIWASVSLIRYSLLTSRTRNGHMAALMESFRLEVNRRPSRRYFWAWFTLWKRKKMCIISVIAGIFWVLGGIGVKIESFGKHISQLKLYNCTLWPQESWVLTENKSVVVFPQPPTSVGTCITLCTIQVKNRCFCGGGGGGLMAYPSESVDQYTRSVHWCFQGGSTLNINNAQTGAFKCDLFSRNHLSLPK